ncbi:MAG: CbtB-domain containing protein [Gammaproteobacteria bacterium]|nr:CbtB-domain containing protein [Gammaproteobacteria bacterium]MDQ7075597.1 CbtB-domain containing protein [Gammaproteobacteria bacterium]
MSNNTLSNAAPLELDQAKVALLGSFLFGAVMMLLVGFLPTEAVHNAAHDTRHSVTFPCH